jgi:RNA polymerase sigma factor (sigma-70 family)
MTLLDPQPLPLDDPGRCTDAELIAAVRAGDRAAYAQLYERHEPAARRMARQLSASPHDVDDLVAEAFARVFDMLSSGRGPDSSFRAYLLTAVRNCMYERARRDRRLELSEDMARHDRGVPWVDPAEAELNSALAAQAFASLPERWRTVLWLCEVEQESTAEVGSRLGLRPNAVAALAYRAREGLRQAFLQAHVTGGDDGACGQTIARLGSWTRDRLSTGDAARVDAHLATCRRCRQVAAELEDVNSGLRGVLAPLLLGGAAATGPLAAVLRDSTGVASAGTAAASAGAGAAGAGAATAGAGTAGAGTAGAGAAGAGTAGAGAATAGAGTAGAGTAGAGAAGAGAAAAAGAVSAGAAAAGGSVLGWLAGAHAGPAAAVLAAVVVGGTAVAAGVAVPHAMHRPPAASAVAGGSADRITSGRPVTVAKKNTPPATKAAKARKATGTAPGGQAGNGRTKPRNPQADQPGQGQTKPPNPQAAAPGNGQTKPKNPQADELGQGQTEPNNPLAAAHGAGQTTLPNSKTATAATAAGSAEQGNAAFPGQNEPADAAAAGKGRAQPAAGAGGGR